MWLDPIIDEAHQRLMTAEGVVARTMLCQRAVTEEEMGLYRIGLGGLVTAPYPEAFRLWAKKFWSGRVVFPLTATSGEVIGVQTRSVEAKEYAQFYSTDSETFPYCFGMAQALPEIWRTRQVVLCEGVFDALAIRKAAPNVLATLTASASRAICVFARRYVERVIVLFDMDPPGRKGVGQVARVLRDLVVVAPEYSTHDPSDLLAVKRYRELAHLTAPAREILFDRTLAGQQSGWLGGSHSL